MNAPIGECNMQDDAYRDLLRFEREADECMKSLSLWSLPYRSVYSAALLAADASYSGGRFGKHREPDGDKGGTMLARYSYWRPYLSKCTQDIGANIADALSVVTDEVRREITQALQYSHFCELMPFAHRQALVVERAADGFRLRYPSETAAEFEALDVIASELALSAVVNNFKYDPRPLLEMVQTWPHTRMSSLDPMLRRAFEFHLDNVREDAFIVAGSYERVLGFHHDEFLRVRAAMMAFSSWCLGMANAAEAYAIDANDSLQDYWGAECLEWLAPLLRRDMVYGMIRQLAGVTADRVDAIIRLFEDDPFSPDGVSGDGYLAPIINFGESILLSPRAIHQMTSERNILYVLNRRDRGRFNELVSAELEPSLLAHAKILLDRIPGIETKTNVLWDGGEIDLLAFCSATNTACQFQAKAAIPANGARMTRQVESNTLTAVRQLQEVERLSTSKRDSVIQATFGVRADNVKWSSGVISRSSFGTASAWEAVAGRAAVNLPLLKLVAEQFENEKNADLTIFPQLAAQTLRKIADEVILSWRDESLEVFGTTLVVPLLQLNDRAIAERRLKSGF